MYILYWYMYISIVYCIDICIYVYIHCIDICIYQYNIDINIDTKNVLVLILIIIDTILCL